MLSEILAISFNLIILTVVSFARGASKTHICSGHSTARRPDRSAADDAFRTVLLGCEC